MSRVTKKETLYKYFQHGPKIRSRNSDFVSLDRFSFCRAFVVLSSLSLDKYDSIEISAEL